MPSFDVVSRVDEQEVTNAVNQTSKEIQTRYDFREGHAEICLKEGEIQLETDSEMKIKSMQQMLKEKLSKRGIGLKSLIFQDVQESSGGKYSQNVKLKQGIEKDEAKSIVKLVKDAKMKKVQCSIQGDELRVNGPKRDDLQQAIKLIEDNVELELQFVNFRD